MNKSAQKGHAYRQAGLAPLIIVLIAGVVIGGIVIVSKGGSQDKKPALSVSQQTKEKPSNLYTNSDDQVSIQIPKDWTLKENQPGTKAAFFATKEGNDDKFIENVGLSVSDLSAKPNVSLDEIVKAWIDQSKSEFPDSFKVISQDKTTLGGVEAVKMISQAKDNISSLKGMTIIALKDNKAYILNYAAEEKSFDKFLNEVNNIISSFKFGQVEVEWVTFKSEQYGYSLKHPKGWIVKDQSGEDKREVLIMHPANMANALIAARKDDSLKDKSSLEKAIAGRIEFKQSESGFSMGMFDSQAEDKKGKWAMAGEKVIDGKKWAVMERGMLDVYGKVLIEQSGYVVGEGKDYKDIVIQILDSFSVE